MTMEQLESYGANTREGLERCLNNEDFYLSLVSSAVELSNYEALNRAVESGDFGAAFEAAHALKGVLGNLSLDPLYGPVSELTDLLRNNTDTDYSALMSAIFRKRDELAALL